MGENNKRNLLGNTIHLICTDLKRHMVQVILPEEDGRKIERTMYLIMIRAKTSMLSDFEYVFSDALVSMHKKIAEKVFKREETDNDYGLLINEDLKIVFAFNRAFADYDKNKKEIIYRDPDDILSERIEVSANPNSIEVDDFRPPFSGGGGMTIRYSLAEKEDTKGEDKE